MEIIDISPNTDAFYSYYNSAPTSPRRYNQNDFFFLSMPTSPTRDASGFKSGTRTPETINDFSPFEDNFEFEGSKRFHPYDNVSEKSQELTMAYADELFIDGKMLPLRPPPQAQCRRSERNRGNSSTASSPGARGSLLKMPFLRQRSLWNDAYDPFIAALDKVKEESDAMSNQKQKGQLRRAKSLSPLRCTNVPARCNTHQHNKLDRSPDAWMSDNGPWRNGFGPSKPYVSGSILEPKGNVARVDFSESKKQRMKKFLLKNGSFGKAVNGAKKEQNTPFLMRKLQHSERFNSAHSNAIIRISREMKKLMKHRARVFLCLAKGFSIKCTRKMS